MKVIKLFLALLKRLSKKFSFLFLLILVPIVCFALSNVTQEETSKTNVGLFFEDDFGDKCFEDICVYANSINFVEYSTKEELLVAVQKEKIDCGFVFADDFEYRLFNNDWKESIVSYVSPSSLLQSMAQEQIACGLFNIYSEHCYNEYVDTNLGEDKREFAYTAYKNHLEDSSTFSVEYINNFEEVDGEIIQSEESNFEINLKGILGLLIFIAGLNSLLLNREDIDEKRFITYCSNITVTISNIFSQVFVMSIVVFASILLSKSYENLLIEFLSLLMYSTVVCVYCFVLSFILKSKQSIATAIPIWVLLSLICCPVIIDVSTYISVVGYISKIFPLTYYLL